MSGSAAPDFFARWTALPARQTASALEVGGEAVMYDWEQPLMAAFAERLASPERDLLEIGFGMGVFASCAHARAPRSHTIVEPHPEIARSALAFVRRAGEGARLVADYWQRAVDQLGRHDAIFYDSWSPAETLLDDLGAFFRLAATRLLRPGGILGFWVPGPTLSDATQRIVFEHFDALDVATVHGLSPGPDSVARGFGTTMLVPIARGPRAQRVNV